MTRTLWGLLFLTLSTVIVSGQSVEESLRTGEGWEIQWTQQRHLPKNGSTVGSYPLFPDQLKPGEYDIRIGLRLFKDSKAGLSANVTYVSYIELPLIEQLGSNPTQSKLSQPIFLDTRFQDADFNPQLFLFDALLQHTFPISCQPEVIDKSLSDFSKKVNQLLPSSGLIEAQVEWLQETELSEVFTEVSNLEALNQTLKSKGLPVIEAELRWIPGNTVEVTDLDLARSLLKLMDALEELDDVQNVTANFDMTDELMSLSMS